MPARQFHPWAVSLCVLKQVNKCHFCDLCIHKSIYFHAEGYFFYFISQIKKSNWQNLMKLWPFLLAFLFNVKFLCFHLKCKFKTTVEQWHRDQWKEAIPKATEIGVASAVGSEDIITKLEGHWERWKDWKNSSWEVRLVFVFCFFFLRQGFTV